MNILEIFESFWNSTGIAQFFADGGWMNIIMIALGCVLIFLAIKKDFEPYLLIPIAVGMILTNIPGAHIFVKEAVIDPLTNEVVDYNYSGLIGTLYYGVKYEIYPCLIFLGIGATTDFGPLIANKKTMLLGAAAQVGIFVAFFLAIACGFNLFEAGSIGIIGGADGPTAILVSNALLSASGGNSLDLQAPIALAAYSYMALTPIIFPPVIRLLTTKKERQIKMQQLRDVSKREKILFPIIVLLVVALIVPSATPLIGCLMLGNLIKESGVVPNLVHAAGNTILYVCTICLGLSVGATATAQSFLTLQTLMIFGLGIVAFVSAAATGLLLGKLMCYLTHGKINPMIGAAGVSAVPMIARIVHKEGLKEDPSNFLLMHAMGPNVAGVIGSAIAAGMLMMFLL